jgi:flagellar hook-associated protein FlgK
MKKHLLSSVVASLVLTLILLQTNSVFAQENNVDAMLDKFIDTCEHEHFNEISILFDKNKNIKYKGFEIADVFAGDYDGGGTMQVNIKADIVDIISKNKKIGFYEVFFSDEDVKMERQTTNNDDGTISVSCSWQVMN